jgi:hypothetical protein
MASTRLAEAVGYPGSSVAFAQLLSGMERDGLINREVRGKRTYRITLSAQPARLATEPAGSEDADRPKVKVAFPPVIDYDELADRVIMRLLRRLAELNPAELALLQRLLVPGGTAEELKIVLPDAAQSGPVVLRRGDVGLDRALGPRSVHVRALDRGRDAGDQGTRWDVESLGDHGAGGHDRAAADDDAVQREAARADQAARLDDAALQVRVVADHAVLADDRRPLRGAVHDRAVLHRRAGPDGDIAVVAAQHRAGPDRGLRANLDPSDHNSIRRDVGERVDLRLIVGCASDS